MFTFLRHRYQHQFIPFHVERTTLEALSNCPVCAAPTAPGSINLIDHSISKESFTLCDCSSCGFRFTNPRPTPSEIGRYYESDLYISHTNASTSLLDRVYQWARTWALYRKSRLIESLEPSGQLLDIGCGTGEFLSTMKRKGYLVQGVEPNPSAREKATTNHSLSVHPSLGQIEPFEQFRIVTLWHVLEHLPDPTATLKQVFALMAPRGVLVIAVPDRESWDAAYYASNWAAWDVPRHLSHFRRKDVRTLLEKQGFELVSAERMWLDAPYVSILSEKYQGRSSSAALMFGIVSGIRSNLTSLFSSRPSSSTLFVARKTKP